MSTVVTLLAGRYRLLEEASRTDASVIWHAYDELLHREVAVKEIRFADHLPDAERQQLTERALREARVAAAIDTTAAVRVFDVEEQDGRPWVVMEVVPGRPLRQVLSRRRSLPDVDVARVGLAVLEALDVAHRVGVAHCTVTVDNVIVGTDHRIALTDFCIDTVAPGSDDDHDDLRRLGETLRAATSRRTAPPLRELVDRLTAPEPADLPTEDEVRQVLERVVRDARLRRSEPWPAYPSGDGAAATESEPHRLDEEGPVWPPLVGLLVVLVATAIILTTVLQPGG
ncbi:MAG TPA: protein kinase [Mycobacteriales bacterium]|nr:protein kinase [Mycobacteriales bacterium]